MVFQPTLLHNRTRVLTVSRCGFGEDKLVQGKFRDGSSQPLILLLNAFEFLQLVGSHAAIPLTPAVVSLLGYMVFPDRIDPCHSFSA